MLYEVNNKSAMTTVPWLINQCDKQVMKTRCFVNTITIDHGNFEVSYTVFQCLRPVEESGGGVGRGL